jgi:hypothetical protein
VADSEPSPEPVPPTKPGRFNRALLIILIALSVLLVGGVGILAYLGLSSSPTQDPTATDSSPTASQGSPVETLGPIAVGEAAAFTCYYGPVTFTITDEATVTDALGSTKPEESFVYVLVPVKVTYGGSQTYLHVHSRSVLVGTDGTEYLPDLPGMVAAKGPGGETNPFIVLDLRAGEQAEGVFVYQVPELKTHGVMFQLSLTEAPVVTMKTGL